MFKATITRNYRDVDTCSPKILLLNVTEDGKEFRDHCWVILIDELDKFVPYKNKQKLRIQFNAKAKKYVDHENVGASRKSTLHKIHDIKIIKKS